MRIGQPRRLTHLNAKWLAGTFRPDGRQVVFSASVDRCCDIFTVSIDGADLRKLTHGAPQRGEGAFYCPQFSHDGGRIVCQRADAFYEEINDIYLMDADGGDQRPLTSTGRAIQPSFSPDASRIAFASVYDGLLEISAMGSDGTGQIRLTYTHFDRSQHIGARPKNLHPLFTPDGAHILYRSNAASAGGAQGFQIWRVRADGADPQAITAVAGSCGKPMISSDGGRIACGLWAGSQRRGDAMHGFHLLREDGSSVSFLWEGAPCPFDDTEASLSSDGGFIVFSGSYGERDEGGRIRRQLCLLDTITGHVSRLTTSSASDSYPVFSPDGAWLLFMSNRDGGYDLYIAAVSQRLARSRTYCLIT